MKTIKFTAVNLCFNLIHESMEFYKCTIKLLHPIQINIHCSNFTFLHTNNIDWNITNQVLM